MGQWIDQIRLQDAALLVAAAWMPVARASTEMAVPENTALPFDMTSAPGLTGIIINLAIVLGAIVALAMVVRRAGIIKTDAGGALRVHASLALGPKERLMIVDADGHRVLIGASAQGLTALHVLGRTAVSDTSPATEPQSTPATRATHSFASVLRLSGRGSA